MGITAGPSFTTEQGFEISLLYLSVNYYRLMSLPEGHTQCVFGVQGFKSREDKRAGRQPVVLPPSLSMIESTASPSDFFRMSIQGLAYAAIKARWASMGYTISDVYESGQATASQYIYDSSGFNVDGYNFLGFNAQGFNNHGYTAQGFNAQGFNALGYNVQGYNSMGFNEIGYNAEGFNMMGYNAEGYNKDGYTMMGYNAEGYNMQGYNREGFNSQGFDIFGYNAQGLNAEGNPRPVPIMIPSTVSVHVDASGAHVDLSGVHVDLSGAHVDLSGVHVDLSGSNPPE